MNFSHSTALPYDPDLKMQLQQDILQEIYKAAKFPKIQFIRDSFRPFFHRSSQRFSELIAGIDHLVMEHGFVKASHEALCRLCEGAVSFGKENIPKSGPVVIASNHPGNFDGFAIISQLPRGDIRIVVSGIPFFRNLPNAGKHLIYTGTDTYVQMDVIRKSIRHLGEGGSLLIFPAGRIEPDPSILQGAGESLQRWSRSIEVFLRKVPKAKLVLAITSGVLSKEFINHPLTKFFKNDHERRRIMEFMQMIKQMIRGKPVSLKPRVSFASPLTFDQIQREGQGYIAAKANELLDQHVGRFYPNIMYPKIW
ncbi:MAG: hypothetical protein FJZ98_04225 [Chloroflexi bacterium]|nr:hypothetical protein [Chloroflexota bacterium]